MQQPRPPILVGGGGREVLTLAGARPTSSGINPNLARRRDRRRRRPRHARRVDRAARSTGCAEGAGERFDDIELQIRYFVAAITDDAAALAEVLAPAFGVDADEALESGAVLVGTVDEVCDTLVAPPRGVGRLATSCSATTNFEQFAPVVARLAGT